MVASPQQQMVSLLLLLLLVASSSPAVLAASGDDADEGLTHIHLFIHETFSGAKNATTADVAQSPLGANSSFGSVGVVDDELRVGRDRSSQLVGRFQGVIVGTSVEVGAGFLTTITFVFTAGEHAGGTLSIQGPILDFNGTIERAVVGGTGKFRLARGYTLTKILPNPTPETGVFEVDLFVLMHSGKKSK